MSKLRGQIFAAQDLASEVVTVPEWSNEEGECKVLLKAPGLASYSKMLKDCRVYEDVTVNGVTRKDASTDTEKLTLVMVVECSFDPETKERLFTAGDLDELGKKSGTVIDRIGTKVFQLLQGNQAVAEKNS